MLFRIFVLNKFLFIIEEIFFINRLLIIVNIFDLIFIIIFFIICYVVVGIIKDLKILKKLRKKI